jgi:two-component system cell cycle sensor histidine kinase/response regulator CckA
MNDPVPQRETVESRIERRLLAGAWKESLSRATLGYAHDLNNALTGILGVPEPLLLEAKPGDALTEHLFQLKRSARQAAQLVDALVALHQSRSGHRDYHDVNLLVSQSVEFLKRSTPRGIEFDVQLFQGTLPVHLDAQDVHQAAANLVLNAATAMSDRGTVIVRTSREERVASPARWFGAGPPPLCAMVTVQDHGCGISSGVLDRLFEPPGFMRSDGGLGLGLLQVRRLLESCGGGLGIVPAGECGTTVALLLPLVDLIAD